MCANVRVGVYIGVCTCVCPHQCILLSSGHRLRHRVLQHLAVVITVELTRVLGSSVSFILSVLVLTAIISIGVRVISLSVSFILSVLVLTAIISIGVRVISLSVSFILSVLVLRVITGH